MPANDVVLLDSIIEKAGGYLGSGLEQSDLFELFCFDQILKNYDLSYDELESGHVDGGDDGGIDGLFVFLDDKLITDIADVEIRSVRRNPEIEIIVTTCKYGTQFKQIPINNLISSLSELFDLRKTTKDILYPFDSLILKIRETFRRLYVEVADRSPFLKINVYYASRGDTTNLNPNISSRAKELEIRLSSLFSQVETQVVFLGASELLHLARKQRSYSLRISFIENVISRAKTNYIILTTLSDYYRFITDEDLQLRRYLFEANVRDYFGPNNNVIADIRDSLESKLSKDEADFWWFSNGITLLASSAMIVGKELSLENVQIVNGLQTSNAIYEHFSRVKRNNDDRALLLKIVVADNEDVRVKIIKATNYQNVVDLASLRATDKIQRDIEEYLLGYNWFYDRRKNYYKNQGKPADRIVSTSLLGAVIRALVLRNPNAAAEQQTKWMKNDQDYEKVFDPNFGMRVFLVCLEISKIIDPYMRDKTRPAGKLPYIDDKKAKYIVGLIYLANILRSTSYTPDEIANVEKYLDLGDIKMIVGHVLTCFEKYKSNFEVQSKKVRNLASGEFITFALNQLESNNFNYLPYSPPFSDVGQATDDKESPKQTEKAKVAEHLRLASEYDFERNFSGAIEELNACLQEDLLEHRQAMIHSHMGRIYAKMDDIKSSIDHYQTALSLGLQTSELYAGYARSLYKFKDDPKRIRSLFDTAIQLDKTNARAHNWYATFLKSIGEMEKAEEHAKKALQLMPNHPLFLHNLALLLMEKKDKDSLLQAEDLLKKSIARARPGFDYPKQVLQDVQNMLAAFHE